MRGRDAVNYGCKSKAMNSQEYPSCSPCSDEASTNTTTQPICDHRNEGKNVLLQHDQTPDVPCPLRREALRLNHEAVNILTSGAGEEQALRIFKFALSRMKDKLASVRVQEGGTATSATSVVDYEGSKELHSDVRLQSCSNHLSSCLLVPVSLSKAQESSMIRNDSFFFYSKVLTFQLSDNMDDNMTRRSMMQIDSESLSSTIIYNIGMVIALKGIRTNSSVLLKKAVDLFKLSLDLLPHPSQVQSSTTRCLSMVCWNNLAQIAYLQCQFDEVQTMRQMLETLLTEYFSTLSVEQELARTGVPPLFLFDEDEIQGFKSNIMFMNPPNTAPTA